MPTRIAVDEDLLDQALEASGLGTQEETVEAALRLLILLKNQASIRKFRGKMQWEGNWEDLRAPITEASRDRWMEQGS